MEQHPVPQNVTSFQFRLIGDMTIKQFGYLALFAVIGYICYKLPFPTFLTLPLGVGMFLFGFGLAFVPIEERPMDAWVLAFIKSIYSPTQYIWHREPPPKEPAPGSIPEKPQGPTLSVPAATAPRPAPAVPAQASVAPVQPVPAPQPVLAHTPNIPTSKPAAKPQPAPAPPHASPKNGKTASSGLFGFVRGLLFGKKQELPPQVPQQTQPLPVQPAPVSYTPQIPVKQKEKSGGFFAWLSKLLSTPPKPKAPAKPVPAQAPPVHGYQGPPAPPPSGPDVFAKTETPPIVKEHLEITNQAETEAENVEKRLQDVEQAAEARAQEKTRELEEKLMSMQEELKTHTVSQERILELQKQLTDVLSQKNLMEAELRSLRSKLSESRAPQPATRQAGVTAPETRGATVKVITAETAVSAGLPRLTTYPNVVTGIIKDFTGNLLPGVLVTVRDREGTPVRALKTNKLGQFAASTPLPNNTYVLEVEDPRNRFVFDRIQITLNGGVVPAVEIIAKSERELSRKKLEEEIFGNQNI